MFEVLIGAFFLAFIPAIIASSKGRSFITWWIYGFLLFLIALIHSIVIKPTQQYKEQEMIESGMKKCPFCAELIKPDAKVCRYCGRDLPVETINLSPYQKSNFNSTDK